MIAISNKSIETISMDQIVDIANKVVSRYVYRSVIPTREKDDVVMAIVEKFLKQKNKIEQAYEGKSKISTYFVAILNRMCCEIIRKESKHWYSITNDESEMNSTRFSTLSIETEKTFAITNEVKRLDNTLLFFNGERPKINLFLKYYFDLPYDQDDIKDYAKDKYEEVKIILVNPESASKAQLFENLALVVNLVEGKDVKGDAVRMWLNKQIDVILNRLNRNGIANHDKQSLAVLFEIQNTQAN
jgi:DNA-directed RNA polymerase specialized sigma24 family protein